VCTLVGLLDREPVTGVEARETALWKATAALSKATAVLEKANEDVKAS
jgi:hypothetical protein